MATERRQNDSLLLEKIEELQGNVATMKQTIDKFESRAVYIDMLIAREKDRAAFRKAVIEKSLVSLISAAAIYVFYATLHQLTGK